MRLDGLKVATSFRLDKAHTMYHDGFGRTHLMPTWSELQLRRRETDRKATRVSADEVLVLDARARMTPGNFVEEKLRLALSNERRAVRRVPK
jgi:hypothetical protein